MVMAHALLAVMPPYVAVAVTFVVPAVIVDGSKVQTASVVISAVDSSL